ncbi:uncharacterized protein LOC130926845 [Corythoichthys intestinalis]|uniref:uncharacterized protein LOC130926845 n=1 Tax=Corythoichthys intestinalis TaxID=161448 RepID=UPI0025A5BD07|nr:uncharacterized protein LOC130926845 [Corythoichthys intestinalis]
MTSQSRTSAIDNILFQLAIEARKLTQKKNDINQEVEVYKADIVQRRTYIETMQADIKKMKENVEMKHNNLNRNREVAKSMEVTQGMLLQYERTLKMELESIKSNYNNDKDVYEEKMASYRKLYQEHQKPYVQKIQMQNDDMESSFTASQDDVIVKVKEADHHAYISDFGAPRSTSDEGPESDLHLQPHTETVMQMESSPVKDSTAAVWAVNVDDTKICASGPETSVGKDIPSRSWDLTSWMPDTTSSNEQHVRAEDVGGQDGMTIEEEEQAVILFRKTPLSVVLEEDEEAQWQMEEGDATEEEQPLQEHGALPPLQCEQIPSPSFPAPKTPTFAFNFSPTPSIEGSSENKSPGFMFSISSNSSTPAFSGFGCDDGGDEDAPFSFSSSFFKNKKKQDNKSGGLEFLFNKSDQGDDFQLPFASTDE